MNIDLEKINKGNDFLEKKALTDRPKNIPKHKKYEEGLPLGKAFERRIWRLFHNMGAVVSNGSKHDLEVDLNVSYQKQNASQKSKQLDGFFIMRDKFAFVVECKDNDTKRLKKSTTLITQNFNNWQKLRKPINSRLRATLFGKNTIREPKHIIATKGYDWSDNDLKTLKKAGFLVLTEMGIDYLESCFSESKSSWFTFNQFLSFYLSNVDCYGAGLKDTDKQYVGFRTKSSPGKDGIFETEDDIYAYTTSMRVIDLLKISTVAHKKAEDIDKLGNTTKNYYQRILKSNRLNGIKSIPKFIKEKQGPFSNNLLINYRGDKNLDEMWTPFDKGQKRGGLITFEKLSPGMFHLIDGQHRLFGYAPIIEEDGEDSDFGKHELIITLFDKMEPQDEARNFLQINKNQKPIDASLVLEVQLVFGAYGPPDEVLENLATTLVQRLGEQNKKSVSPFASPVAIKQSESMKKIDHTGKKIEQGALTIRGMVTNLVNSKLLQVSGDFSSGYAFVNEGKDEADKFKKTCDNLFNIYTEYFAEVKKARPGLWKTTDKAGKVISNKSRIAQNIPIGGFIILLDHFVTKKSKPQKKILNAEVKKLIVNLCDGLKKMSDADESALFDGKTYGGSGPRQFYHQLLENFHPSLIDKDTQNEIDKYKKDFNANSAAEIKKIENKYETRIKNILNSQNLVDRLKQYEEGIRDTNHEVFEKLFGKDFWASGGRALFDDYFQDLGPNKYNIKSIAENARKNRYNDVTKTLGLKWQESNDYPHMMMWLQWDHWYWIQTELFDKSQQLQKKSIFSFTSQVKDLRYLVRHLYFIHDKKPAKQCTPKEGLNWFLALNAIRNPPSHPSGYSIQTEEEFEFFISLEDKIKTKLERINSFLTQ